MIKIKNPKYVYFPYRMALSASMIFLVLSFLFISACLPAHAEEPEEHAMINITAGQVGVLDDHLNDPQRYGLEYRFKSFSGPGEFRLIPAVGFATAKNGAKFIYTDLRHDFYLNQQWLLIPSFGVGIFDDSEEIQLGNEIEYRSGIEIAYQFRNKVRAGIAIFHLSNGGTSSTNPGTEALVFAVCFPIMN